MTTWIVTVCLHMIVYDCIHKRIKSQKAWPLPDITPFSHMQKIEITGASDLASLFYTNTFLNQACAGRRPMFTWFLEIVCERWRMCVRVSTPEGINNNSRATHV